MEKPAIVIVDMLNDFVTGKLQVKRTLYIIPNIKKLVDAARKKGVPVIYSNDAHYPQDVEVTQKWGNHAIKNTKGAEVIPELKPAPTEYQVEKRTYSGFYETGLDSILRVLYDGEGVKTVILCGLHTHMCVRHTAADAFFRGYKIVVASDGVEAFTKEDHEQGLKYLENTYNAKIMSVDEITREFSAS